MNVCVSIKPLILPSSWIFTSMGGGCGGGKSEKVTVSESPTCKTLRSTLVPPKPEGGSPNFSSAEGVVPHPARNNPRSKVHTAPHRPNASHTFIFVMPADLLLVFLL